MSDAQPENSPPSADNFQGLAIAVQGLQSRVDHLEAGGDKSLFKRLTENASAAALLIGLALTVAQVRETFFSKPEADRISQLSAFNQAVGEVARLRQELAEMPSRISDANSRLVVAGVMTSRILNAATTATAMLPDMKDRDVGVPQLIVLINEALNNGDMKSVDMLTQRAANKTNVTDFQHSEALRYRAQFYFAVGDASSGRKTIADALTFLAPQAVAARAYDVMFLVTGEMGAGACADLPDAMHQFMSLVSSPQIATEQRGELVATLRPQYEFTQRVRCTNLPPVESAFPN
jgi:hypothetical protein